MKVVLAHTGVLTQTTPLKVQRIVLFRLRIPVLQEYHLLRRLIQPDPTFSILAPPQLIFVIGVKKGVSSMQVLGLIKFRLIVEVCGIGIVSLICNSHTFLEGIGRAYIATACVACLQTQSLRGPELAVTIQGLVPGIGHKSLL